MINGFRRLIAAGLLEYFQRRQARGHRDWVTAERSGLIHRPGGADHFHQLAAAAVRGVLLPA